MITSRK